MEDLTGKQFGPYQIVAPLGEGGMAAVYKGYQPAMERYVAIKVLPRHMVSSPEFMLRFQREARFVAQLQHPNILPVFDYGEADGYAYIVMPFAESGTLADLLTQQRLNLFDIRRIMIQLCDALVYAHGMGLIHRDLKPSNVLLDARGNGLLTDFGLARMTEASIKLTTSGTIMGTPAYMSPEQGMGSHLDHRSDLYALGIIFYEMVTGRVPYTAETPLAILFKHVQDPLPSARSLNPELNEKIELVLLKALAKKPEDRFQSAEAFQQAIEAALPDRWTASPSLPRPPPRVPEVQAIPHSSTGAEVVSQVSRPQRKQPQPLWLFVTGLILLLLCLAGLGLWYGRASLIPSVIPSPTSSPIVLTNTPVPPLVRPTVTPRPTATSRPTARIACADNLIEVNLRKSPGYLNKNDDEDRLVKIPCGETVFILDGPVSADALDWWHIAWGGYEGWVADHTGSGRTILIFNP